jgi:fermentation-respiration switch protein FrsA (DUF1100 family)
MQRKVNFYSDGLRLEGVVFVPDGYREGDKLPGVVICHGFTQHKEIFGLTYGESLVRHGLVCLSFDYRGFGGSEGQRGRIIPLEQVNDIRNALTFLALQPEVDPERIGVLGTSFGGANVLHVGAVDKRVRTVVCFDGIGNGGRWLRGQRRHTEWLDFLDRLAKARDRRVLTGELEYVDVGEISVYSPQSKQAHEDRRLKFPDWQSDLPLETGEKVIEFHPEDIACQISPRPLLVIYDKNPRGHALEEALAIYEKAAEPKKLVAIGPSSRQYSHYFGEELEHWIKICADWYHEHLAPETSA